MMEQTRADFEREVTSNKQAILAALERNAPVSELRPLLDIYCYYQDRINNYNVPSR